MKNKPIRYLIIGIIVVALLFSIKMYNDYREKSLDDVIIYNSSSFNSFEFKFKGNTYNDWKTDKKEPVEELIEFLSQYQVKKMKDVEWDSDVSKEKGFEMIIFSKGKPIMASIFEDRIHFYGSGYYKVVNGPTDMNWVLKYNEEYQQ